MTKPQGTGYSQLIQLMRKHGHNKDVEIELGTVTAPPPEVLIRLDSFGFDLDKSDLIFAGKVVESSLQEGDRVIVISNESHKIFYVIDKAVKY